MLLYSKQNVKFLKYKGKISYKNICEMENAARRAPVCNKNFETQSHKIFSHEYSGEYKDNRQLTRFLRLKFGEEK